jgi:hypothetical protein
MTMHIDESGSDKETAAVDFLGAVRSADSPTDTCDRPVRNEYITDLVQFL